MDVALWKCKIDKYKKKFSTKDTWGAYKRGAPIMYQLVKWSLVSVCHSQVFPSMASDEESSSHM